MDKRIIRPQDMDQVLFLGENSIYLVEHRLVYPEEHGGFYGIIYGEPYFGGLLKREKTATTIDARRILKTPVNIKGNRTLVVMADLDATDKNRSFLDLALYDYTRRISELERENKHLENTNVLMNAFVKSRGLESTWEEWALNKLELLRVAQKKMAPSEAAPPISLEVGGDVKQKKPD